MQAVAGERDPRLAGKKGANGVIPCSHNSIRAYRAELLVTPATDTTLFPCALPACIFEMYFPVPSEGKVWVAGTLVLLGSMGGFVL